MTLFENLLGHTLIAADNVWGLMGVMCIGVALSIHLEQKYQWASKVSGRHNRADNGDGSRKPRRYTHELHAV